MIARVIKTLNKARMNPDSVTWQRLNKDRTPGRYGRWYRPDQLYKEPRDYREPPYLWVVTRDLMNRLPPECVSPSGKLRSPRPDLSIMQIIKAIRILAERDANLDRAINEVLDMPSEQVEGIVNMRAMERLVGG